METKTRKAQARHVAAVLALKPGDKIWVAQEGHTAAEEHVFRCIVGDDIFVEEFERVHYHVFEVFPEKVNALRALLRGVREMTALAHQIELRLQGEIAVERQRKQIEERKAKRAGRKSSESK